MRGWYPPEVLADMVTTVGEAKVLELLAIVAAQKYRGSPDLFLWSSITIEFAEIKSSTDVLSTEQHETIRCLTRVATCIVYCTCNIDICAKRCRPNGEISSESESSG